MRLGIRGDRDELDGFDRWLNPDIVVRSAGGGSIRGVGARRDTWTAAHAGLDTVSHVIEELVVADDMVAARVGRGPLCGDHRSDTFEDQASLP